MKRATFACMRSVVIIFVSVLIYTGALEAQTHDAVGGPASIAPNASQHAGTKFYRNPIPAFEIFIPEGCRDWEFRYNNAKEKPIAFFKARSNNLPFINTYIDFYDSMDPATKALWSDADKLFASKIATDKRLEKEVLADVEFLSEKMTSMAGLPAFDRVYKSEKSGATYHALYILFPKGMVQFILSAWSAWYEQDDKEFVIIIGTLKPL